MRIFALGENAVSIEFGNAISAELNDRAISLAEHFRDHPFPGLIEAVPAYASVTLFYHPSDEARSGHLTMFDAVRVMAEKAIDADIVSATANRRTIEIPADLDEKVSLDILRLSEYSGLEKNAIIDIFLSRTYRVHMLGFLPGFAYMADVDDRIAAPRLETPRTTVPKGSIGIAGKQTGIYSIGSPGGWNIIGRTDIELFDRTSDEPCLLRAGDEVRFVSR